MSLYEMSDVEVQLRIMAKVKDVELGDLIDSIKRYWIGWVQESLKPSVQGKRAADKRKIAALKKAIDNLGWLKVEVEALYNTKLPDLSSFASLYNKPDVGIRCYSSSISGHDEHVYYEHESEDSPHQRDRDMAKNKIASSIWDICISHGINPTTYKGGVYAQTIAIVFAGLGWSSDGSSIIRTVSKRKSNP